MIRNHRFTIFLLTMLSGIVLLIIMSNLCEAHAASDLELEYDHEEQVLHVTISHSVSDPQSHYIETVEIRKNDELIHSEEYSEQPDDSQFTYSYNITAENDDELEVFVECNRGGTRTERITVETDNDSLTISISPEVNSMESGSIVDFTITVTSGDQPQEKVNISFSAAVGEIGNFTENGNGNYSIQYTAPTTDSDSTETIEIIAKKEGYEDGDLEFNFTIRKSQKTIEGNGSMDGVIETGDYLFSVSFGEGEFRIYWTIYGDTISMAIVGETQGWLSVGFEPSQDMKDADMIIGSVDADGNVHVVDAYSTGAFGPHPPDVELGGTNDILNYGGSENDGRTIIEFERKLVTGDEYDNVIPMEGKLNIIWAMGGSDSFDDVHDRISRGTGSIQMETGESEEEDEVDLWPLHAVLMTIGLISMFIGVTLGIFRKKPKIARIWLK